MTSARAREAGVAPKVIKVFLLLFLQKTQRFL